MVTKLDRAKRESHFPAIEKRYGESMNYWFTQMKKVKDKKYPEQIAFLKENFGFSQAHANALVMFTRGSKSSRRFETPKELFASIDKNQAKKAREIFAAIKSKHPKLQLVVAWNKPMLKSGDAYVFGLGFAKHHILIAPWNPKVLIKLKTRLSNYEVNKKTIRIPNDWKVDRKLLQDLVSETLRGIKI
jgi:uncharacterized protein YdhG (YjbR/CyaY superfamily)